MLPTSTPLTLKDSHTLSTRGGKTKNRKFTTEKSLQKLEKERGRSCNQFSLKWNFEDESQVPTFRCCFLIRLDGFNVRSNQNQSRKKIFRISIFQLKDLIFEFSRQKYKDRLGNHYQSHGRTWTLWVTKQFTWTGSLLLWLFCVLQTSWWFKLWPWTATNYVSCSSPYNTTNSRMSLPLILTFIPIISFHKVLSPLVKSAKIHAYHLSNVDFRVTEISGKYL